MESKTMITKKDVGTGGLILSVSAFFVGCIIGACFFGDNGFLVGATLGIICLFVAPHLE
jgi:hypothetical protein